MQRPSPGSRGLLPGAMLGAALAPFAAMVLASGPTRATHVDPTEPATIVVGPSPGIAPMAGVDGARRGRTRHPLPDHPKVLWRHSVRTPLDPLPLCVDQGGAILLPSANVAQVVQLAADGKEHWRASTGGGPAVTGAVISNDGTRLLVTSAGDIVGFSPAGTVRFATQLELSERNARIGLLPLEDGGIAIAAGHEVIEIDGGGRVRTRIRLDERATGRPVLVPAGIAITTPSGSVYVLRSGHARQVGTFGGDPGDPGASSPDGRALVSVVDHQRVVTMDLATGATETRFVVTDQSLVGPVVFGGNGAAVFTTWTGLLLAVAPSGDVRRTPLELRIDTLVTDAGKVDFAALDESPAPVADSEGRIAFSRVGGRIGVVAPNGAVTLVSGPTCTSPAALAPAGPGRFAVSCRDGNVLMVGEDTR